MYSLKESSAADVMADLEDCQPSQLMRRPAGIANQRNNK